MPSPVLKCVSMRQDNTQTLSLGVWKEVGTFDGGGKVIQEMMIDADRSKVIAKKEAKNCQMQTKTRLTKKESFGKTMHYCNRYVIQYVFETSGKTYS